jgi:hypothetical protein
LKCSAKGEFAEMVYVLVIKVLEIGTLGRRVREIKRTVFRVRIDIIKIVVSGADEVFVRGCIIIL